VKICKSFVFSFVVIVEINFDILQIQCKSIFALSPSTPDTRCTLKSNGKNTKNVALTIEFWIISRTLNRLRITNSDKRSKIVLSYKAPCLSLTMMSMLWHIPIASSQILCTVQILRTLLLAFMHILIVIRCVATLAVLHLFMRVARSIRYFSFA
jgi:hypothetical protein